MPLFGWLPFLAFFIGTSLPSILFRAMSILGLGIITYTGTNSLLSSIENLIVGYFSELPEGSTDILGYLGFDVAISMLVSAYGIRLTLITARRFVGVKS